jgi:hypothetical protein
MGVRFGSSGGGMGVVGIYERWIFGCLLGRLWQLWRNRPNYSNLSA